MNGPTIWRNADGSVRSSWQILVFGLCVIGSSIIVGSVGYGMISIFPVQAWAREAHVSLSYVATFASIALATALAPRFLGRTEGAATLAGLGSGAWNPKVFALGFLAGVVIVGVPTGLLVVSGAARFEPSTASESQAMAVWAAFALFLPAAFAEELLFRGFAWTVAERAAGTMNAIALSSVFFGIAHLQNPGATPISIIGVTLAGVLLSAVRARTGSLAAAVVVHLAFNVTQSTVFHAPVSGIALPMPGYKLVPTGPEWLTGGAWGPEGGIAVVGVMALATFLLLRNPRTTSNSNG